MSSKRTLFPNALQKAQRISETMLNIKDIQRQDRAKNS